MTACKGGWANEGQNLPHHPDEPGASRQIPVGGGLRGPLHEPSDPLPDEPVRAGV